MQTIQDVLVNDIRPDPNQPRKSFDPVRIKEMAQSLKTEGMVNPIEIDEKMVIITGEMRWRSAKEAGFTEVPCKIIKIEGRDRYRRQVIENIHHNTMTAMETARGLSKLLATPLHVEQGKDSGLSQLSRELGKSREYISQHLDLLKERPEVMEWLDKPGSSYSLIRDAGKAPEKYKEALKDKVVEGKIDSYDAVVEMAQAMKREPEKAEELLKLDLSGKTQADAVQEIRHVVPKEVEPLEEMQKGSFIIRMLNKIIQLIIKTLPTKIIQTDRVRILQLRDELNQALEKYELNAALEGKVI